jgi:hypothetical protein
MEKLSWITVMNLVEKVGLPIALWIIRKAQSGGTVQPGELEELEAMSKTKPEDLALNIIEGLGMSLDDPKVVSVLAKIGKTPTTPP